MLPGYNLKNEGAVHFPVVFFHLILYWDVIQRYFQLLHGMYAVVFSCVSDFAEKNPKEAPKALAHPQSSNTKIMASARKSAFRFGLKWCQ